MCDMLCRVEQSQKANRVHKCVKYPNQKVAPTLCTCLNGAECGRDN